MMGCLLPGGAAMKTMDVSLRINSAVACPKEEHT